MTLERRREGLVITSLPLQDMALLSLAVPLSPEGEAVLAALLRGEKVFVLPQGLELPPHRAPGGV